MAAASPGVCRTVWRPFFSEQTPVMDRVGDFRMSERIREVVYGKAATAGATR
jgi:hypothetical protein